MEHSNKDLENMLMIWMQAEKSSHWSTGLWFAQLMKNQSYHAGIKMFPYKALFGCRVYWLNTWNLSPEVLQNLINEGKFQEIV